jgi:hypothetical protein
MGGIVSDILPFVLAGAFLPTWTLMTIALLETDRPVRNSVAFVSGNVVFRLALGLVVLFVLGEAPVFEVSEPAQTPASVWVFVIAGLAFLALAVREFIHRNEPAGAGVALLDRFERLSPVTSFVAGALVVAAPGVQWVYFLGGMDVIIGAEAGVPAALLATLLFVAALQVMLVVPIAIYLAFPKTARARLDFLDQWIRANSRRVSAAILGLLGVYLVWRGVSIAIAIELI